MNNLTRIDSIFCAAIDVATEQERRDYVTAACGDDTELLARVEKLLSAHFQAGRFLADADDPGSETRATESDVGQIIGPYRLLQLIGEGGMGFVYMAEQTVPVARRVAVKIIKRGMDSRQVIARFEAERQALAVMEHPNIAKVVDAGTTDSGRPYFVMELVKGVPITQYCDQHKLSVRERLELFVPVCHAIQHAHQKGIIHRDVKPSNVLVARYDDRPAPKIIDFGVAKATQQKLTEKTVFTQFGQIVGTFEYMSPEQAQLNHLDIDTRSDVYSLGVLLYELLTGQTPFDGQRLRTAAFDELLRIIREEDPPRPSLRLTTSGTLPETAANRHVEPKRLSSLVRGELDWIVMKTLEKDRTRRYETATALAADIEHYLNDEPVTACPPSSIYLIGKFSRRNKGWLSTAAVLLVTVLVGLTVSTVLIARERDTAERAAAQAEKERERAEDHFRKARDAVDHVFTRAAEEMEGQPHMEQIRRKLLEVALEFYEGFAKQKSDDPAVRLETAKAYQRVGRILQILGHGDESDKPLRESLSRLEKLVKEFPANPEYRDELGNTVNLLRWVPGLATEDVLSVARRRVEIYESLSSDFPNVRGYHSTLAYALTSLGLSLSRAADRPADGVVYLQQAVDTWEKIENDFPNSPPDRFGMAHALHWLGSYYWDTNQLLEAEQCYQKSLRLREQLMAEEPTNISLQEGFAQVNCYMAALLNRQGKYDQAEALVRRAITIRDKLHADYPDIVEHRIRLGTLYGVLGQSLEGMRRIDESEQAYRMSAQIEEGIAAELPSADPARVNPWKPYISLGCLLHETGRVQEAADTFRLAQEELERHVQTFPDDVSALDQLGWFLLTCPASQFREPERALELCRRVVQSTPMNGRHWNSLGVARYRTGDWQGAVEALEKSVELQNGGDETDWLFLAMAYHQLGNDQQAREWYNKAVDWFAQNATAPGPKRTLAEAKSLLGIAEDEEVTDPE